MVFKGNIMTISNPSAFYLLGAFPLLLVLSLQELLHTRAILKRFGIQQTGFTSDFAYFLRWFASFICLSGILLSIIFALAGPVWGEDYVEEDLQGMELMLVLDVSNSMSVTDLGSTRLERAREILLGLVADLDVEASWGLVTFRGEAKLDLALTNSTWALERSLGAVSFSSASGHGSRLDTAILLALQSFPSGSRAFRSIVVASDGANPEYDESLRQLVLHAANSGVSLVFIGVGSTTPSPQDLLSQELKYTGIRTEHAALREDLFRGLTELSRGLYIATDDQSTANRLASRIESLARERRERGFRLQGTRRDFLFTYSSLAFIVLLWIVRMIPWRAPWKTY
jgi:Ca-activated chloride channel family protein